MSQPDPRERREPRERGGEMSQSDPREPREPRERGLTTWAPRRGRGVDFDGWLTWECDGWSRAEHVAFEAIDTCIVWLT